MSYLVLARRCRPQTFEDVTGQEHVTRTLQNSVRRNRVAHAYLFTGLRGVGKTSIARIFAKSLNCCGTGSPTPCEICTSCKEIRAGSSLAVREIDGASHNSVDNVRELIESFRTVPPPGYRYKVYIIDEVHMLSTAAFNALLKSLEEPPPHTVFILATTELHKIPDTILSRCQRHDLRALPHDVIVSTLQRILNDENIVYEESVLGLIARLSEGSMRDAQSLLERLLAYSENELTLTAASSVFGIVSSVVLQDLAEAIINRQSSRSLDIVESACAQAVDLAILLKEFVAYWHSLLWVKFGDKQALLTTGVSVQELTEQSRLAQLLSQSDLHDLVHLARTGADEAMRSFYPRYAFEAIVVRMATRERTAEMADLLSYLHKSLEQGLSTRAPQGGVGVRASQQASVQQQATPSPPSLSPRVQEGGVKSVSNAAALSDSQSEAKSDLDWREFVVTFACSRAPLIGEYLERLHVKQFAAGILKAEGPEFLVNSLSSEGNKTRLLELLSAYSKMSDWRVSLSVVGGDAATSLSGSVQREIQREMVQNQQQRTEQIQNHPIIKTLQKVFPGSSIEKPPRGRS
jgi:DNA polymerase III subunit gamma/tau